MTSILEEKYKESIAAAQLLKNVHYSSTVNRAYYGCFQFMLHILYKRIKIDPKKFAAQCRQNNDGTHGGASKLIAIELGNLPDKEDFKWFQSTFPAFQKLRVKADYSEDQITQSESFRSIDTANAIINVVNKKIKQK